MIEQHRMPEPRDLLTAYALGLLDDAAAARVEAVLAADPALLEELYAAAPLDAALREDPAHWSGWLTMVLAGREAAARRGRWERLVAAAVPALAAAVLVMALLGQVTVNRTAGLASLAPLPHAGLAVRAAGTRADSLFAAAMRDYRAGRYGRAAAVLAAARHAAGPHWSHRDQARLYQGVASLLAGHPARARGVLTEVAESPLPPLAERARWYLAQADLLLGDAEAAAHHLRDLQGSPVYGSRAATLLARLRRR